MNTEKEELKIGDNVVIQYLDGAQWGKIIGEPFIHKAMYPLINMPEEYYPIQLENGEKITAVAKIVHKITTRPSNTN